MQQSIEVLLLPLMDLNTAINQELQDNPLLEMDESVRLAETEANIRDHIERRSEYTPLPASEYNPDEDENEERPIRREDSLEEKLLQHLRVEFSDPLDVKIGEMIIGNLNDDGYLKITCEEIAQNCQLHATERVEKVLKRIQKFDPIGIASRDISECLLIQAHEKISENETLIYRIISECLTELGQKRYAEIAKKLSSSLEEVKRTARLIATQLDPRPARNHRPVSSNIYIKPDIYITQDEQETYHIHLNNDGIPALRVNQLYKNLLKQKNLSPEEKEFIREKLKNAVNFIKSIEQRGATVKSIAQYILQKQAAFFSEGPGLLTPMTMREVAQVLDRNESTVSRAIHNKYMDTPQGLFSMKFFFSQSVGAKNTPEAGLSNRSVKEEIKELIENEDKSHPISDQDIQKHLAGNGMNVARRTIAKYRQAINILPSHLRKQ